MSLPIDLSVLAISPDRDTPPLSLERELEALIDGGITAFMFREKRLDDQAFLLLGRRLRQICDQRGVGFILNERTGLAEPMGARVVHLTWRSRLPKVTAAKDSILMGRSVHSLSEAMDAMASGVDYLVAGPVLPTPSKEGLVETIGLEGLATLCAHVDLPVVAVGGIKADALVSAREAGAVGVSGISCFFGGDDPKSSAAEFRQVWESSDER